MSLSYSKEYLAALRAYQTELRNLQKSVQLKVKENAEERMRVTVKRDILEELCFIYKSSNSGGLGEIQNEYDQYVEMYNQLDKTHPEDVRRIDPEYYKRTSILEILDRKLSYYDDETDN